MGEQTQLGKRIWELRKGHKLTQTDLAAAAGVSKNAISQFEKGVIRPSLATTLKLSETLGEDLRTLIPRIGAFPVASAQFNLKAPIIMGNQYNRLKWDYLRRDEAALPDPATEGLFAQSDSQYEYEVLSLPPSMLQPGVHRVFPMPGNAMAPTFCHEDLMLCRFIDPAQLEGIEKNKPNMTYEEIDALSIYAIESQSSTSFTFEFARVAFDTQRQALACYRDDRTRTHYIPLAEVKLVWQFQYVISKRSPNLAGKLQDMNYELSAAQQKVKQLEAELLKAQEEAAALRAQQPATTEEPAESPQPAPKPDSVTRKRSKTKDAAPAGAAAAQAPGPSA